MKKPGGKPFLKGKPRHPAAGRRKGTPNKVSQLVRDAIQTAFDATGGAEEMARWGKQKANQRAFYEMCCKLIPLQVTGAGFGPLEVDTRDQLSDKIMATIGAHGGNGEDRSSPLKVPAQKPN